MICENPAVLRLPVSVSVKGVVFEDGAVWLRRNERVEWELPGGKLDAGEQPTDTVVRELFEELGMRVQVVAPVHAWRHVIPGSPDENGGVLVLSYLCQAMTGATRLETVGEAGPAEFRAVQLDELGELPMPEFYRRAIAAGRQHTVVSR